MEIAAVSLAVRSREDRSKDNWQKETSGKMSASKVLHPPITAVNHYCSILRLITGVIFVEF